MRFAEGMFAKLCLSLERMMFARVSDEGETCWQDCLTREREMFTMLYVSDEEERCSPECGGRLEAVGKRSEWEIR